MLPVTAAPTATDVAIVGGCGHVGLPLGLAFAEAGLHVSLFDIDARAVALVNDGQMPFEEPGALAPDGHRDPLTGLERGRARRIAS